MVSKQFVKVERFREYGHARCALQQAVQANFIMKRLSNKHVITWRLPDFGHKEKCCATAATIHTKFPTAFLDFAHLCEDY
jgi:hypothetical protein